MKTKPSTPLFQALPNLSPASLPSLNTPLLLFQALGKLEAHPGLTPDPHPWNSNEWQQWDIL